MPQSLKTLFSFSSAALLAAFLASPMAHTQGTPDASKATVKVMTYNLFQGTDFIEVLSAQSLPEFVAATQVTLNAVVASNPPARMQAIAHQIAMTQPDLVGLQEATLWRMGPGPNPTTVLYDPLQELLDALNAEGQHYSAVVVENEYELQGPLPGFVNYLRASGRNILLARSDEADLQLTNAQTANFSLLLQLPTFVGLVTITRGWSSVDAELHGQSFRFIVTHLENPIPQVPATYLIQQAQARELSDVPANTSLPVILVGDFNAIANEPTDPSNVAYQEMLNLGFGDAWDDRNPPRPGLTWPLDNASPADTATQRIDFVFYRGHVTARTSRLAGDNKQDKVDGMWPSDHAGLRALLQVAAY
ncbi:MAG: endonuclease/exonuclease/phosphatase family protein [Acidobacteriota bacterium]|nr:endonuclease/exonuclease/phosphatase family protein [Acidobacteriota bacterium]